MVAKYAERRRELKEKGDFEALRKLPRGSSPTRLKSRCEVTERLRGYLRKLEMSRIAFREYAHKGQVPGVKKAKVLLSYSALTLKLCLHDQLIELFTVA